MATTIKNSSFVSTVTDSVVLNGVSYGNSNSNTYTTCNEVLQRIITIPHAVSGGQDFVSIFGANATPDGAGDVTFSEFKYARITNLDDTNSVYIKITDQDGIASSATPTSAFVVEIPAGMSFILPSGNFDAKHSADIDGNTFTSSTAHNTTMKVYALGVTAAVDIEFLVVTA